MNAQTTNRYLCQFRDMGRDYFKTDCAFDNQDQAQRYIDRITAALQNVAEGQVFDQVDRQVVYNWNKYQ